MTTQAPVEAHLVEAKASAELEKQLAGIKRIEDGEAEAKANAAVEFDSFNWFQKFWHTFDRDEWIRGRKWDYWTWKLENEYKRRQTSVRTCEGLIHLANAAVAPDHTTTTIGPVVMLSHDHARFLKIDG